MWLFKRRKTKDKINPLNQQEKDLIFQYIQNPDTKLKIQLIHLHRQKLREDPKNCRSNCYMSYLAELDNPCPDLTLRSSYRRQILWERT